MTSGSKNPYLQVRFDSDRVNVVDPDIPDSFPLKLHGVDGIVSGRKLSLHSAVGADSPGWRKILIDLVQDPESSPRTDCVQ